MSWFSFRKHSNTVKQSKRKKRKKSLKQKLFSKFDKATIMLDLGTETTGFITNYPQTHDVIFDDVSSSSSDDININTNYNNEIYNDDPDHYDHASLQSKYVGLTIKGLPNEMLENKKDIFNCFYNEILTEKNHDFVMNSLDLGVAIVFKNGINDDDIQEIDESLRLYVTFTFPLFIHEFIENIQISPINNTPSYHHQKHSIHSNYQINSGNVTKSENPNAKNNKNTKNCDDLWKKCMKQEKLLNAYELKIDVLENTITQKDSQIIALHHELWQDRSNKCREEKMTNTGDGLTDAIDIINSEIQKIKQKYDKDKLDFDVYGDYGNNMGLLDELKKYENDCEILWENMELMVQMIENAKEFVECELTPNINNYKSWDLDTIVRWIRLLENGRFVSLIDVLKDGFVEYGITNGSILPELNRNDLLLPPFEINHSLDVRIALEKHFKSLSNGKCNPDFVATIC